MKVSEILSESKKAFPSIEIVPPLRGITKTELLESIRPFMEFNPKYINVTSHRDEFSYNENPDGSFTRHLIRNRISETTVCAAIMDQYDIEVIPHIICAGTTKEEIESKLDNLAFLGINNIVALRGDSMSGEKGSHRLREVTAMPANLLKAYATTRAATHTVGNTDLKPTTDTSA